MAKKRKKIVTGKVWSGFIGEYKHPPVYIIPAPNKDGIFVSDILKKFLRKEVRMTLEEL